MPSNFNRYSATSIVAERSAKRARVDNNRGVIGVTLPKGKFKKSDDISFGLEMQLKILVLIILLWVFVCTELAIITHNLWWSILDAGGIVLFIILVEYRKRQLAERKKQQGSYTKH